MREISFPNVKTHLVRAADLHATPWKNGSGITREVVAEPAGALFDTFIWRISLADVGGDGPFSSFDGVDRILTVIQGNGMVLKNTATGETQTLSLFQPFRFSGEAPVHSTLPDGPIRDHNLMWRRGQATGETKAHYANERLKLTADNTVLHCATGAYRISSPVNTDISVLLEQGDTLVLTLNDTVLLEIDIASQHDTSVLLSSHIHSL